MNGHTWNHRVIEFPDGDEIILILCEVHYKPDGTPRAYNQGAIATGQDYTEIQVDLDRMAQALKRPRLKASDFPTS